MGLSFAYIGNPKVRVLAGGSQMLLTARGISLDDWN
jgi:hypothetical protein